jgi:hypothetical protein
MVRERGQAAFGMCRAASALDLDQLGHYSPYFVYARAYSSVNMRVLLVKTIDLVRRLYHLRVLRC